jgi:hypothetical protein
VLTITTPVEYETVNVGSLYNFRWTSENIDSIYIGGYSYRHDELWVIAEEDEEPTSIPASLGEYSWEIPNDAATDSVAIILFDAADTSKQAIVTPVYIADDIAPVATGSSPENNDMNVLPGADPTIWFCEEVYEGAGYIYIRNSDGSLFESFDISVNGNGEKVEFSLDHYTLQIRPSAEFLPGQTYYIEMDAGVIKDYFDNGFAGISGDGTWKFTIHTVTEDSKIDYDRVKIYPIPAIDKLYIENTTGFFLAEVFNYNGARMIAREIKGNTDIFVLGISALTPGTYMLKLSGDHPAVARKFIKY